MLEDPKIPLSSIHSHLRAEFGLRAREVTFLPLGYDQNTAVYRVAAEDGEMYFLKLRKADFDPIAVEVPDFLRLQGVKAIIPPLPVLVGRHSTAADALQARKPGPQTRLWGSMGQYTMILYPFVDGQNGYETALTDQQWRDFGSALKGVHAARLPEALAARIPRETFSLHWRELVASFQAQVEERTYTDPVAQKLAAFMHRNRDKINRLVSQAAELAAALQALPLQLVLCHADLHAGNLHLTPSGRLHIVDWDNPLFAPKEKDLALIGGSTVWSDPRMEALFYEGYFGVSGVGGHAGVLPGEIDSQALSYYRCERAVVDIAEFCNQLLLTDEGGADREEAYGYLTGMFSPGHEIDLAFR